MTLQTPSESEDKEKSGSAGDLSVGFHSSAQAAVPSGRQADRATRAFLANKRDELRAPVNAVIAYSDILLHDAKDSGFDDCLPDIDKIQTSGRQLLDLINILLDPARLDGARVRSNAEPFAVTIHHDLRTPLNHIIGYSELLIDEAAEQGRHSMIPDLKRIHISGKHLITQIDDLLNLSIIDTENLTLDVKRSGPSAMIHDVVTTIPPLSEDEEKRAKTPRGTLLVVDDNAMNRDLLARHLERQGHIVMVAEHGRQALDRIASHSVDLLLLDIMMPDLNGYQVLQRLKADHATRHIPVLMISALDEIDSVVRCIEIGAADYLPKPLNAVLLKARVDACLEHKRLRDREVMYMQQIEAERKRSDALLHVILPHRAVEELKRTDTVKPRRHEQVAVLFCDIAGFTPYCNDHPPEAVVSHLQEVVEHFEDLTERHGMEKIKTIGDAFMSTAGLLNPVENPALNSVKCGIEMVAAAQRLRVRWQMRVGIHIGPVMAGVVGRRTYVFDIWGDTVNTAARIERHGTAGAVNVSPTVWQHIAADCHGESLGMVPVKGKGALEIFRVDGLRQSPENNAESQTRAVKR